MQSRRTVGTLVAVNSSVHKNPLRHNNIKMRTRGAATLGILLFGFIWIF